MNTITALNALDLNLLKALHVLLQEQNVSRSAERLSLTQPAVSAILARLRHRFDDPLFVRTSHGLTPTPKALSLAEPVARILDDIAKLMQADDFDPKTLTHTLTLAGTENGLRTLGVPFALQLAMLAPRVQIAFVPVQSQDMSECLSRGVWDLAIVGEQMIKGGLLYERLLSERYVCAVRANHPVLSKAWDLQQFCELSFVLTAYHSGEFVGATDDALARLGRTRHVALSVNQFSLLPDLLRHSDLATVAPYHALRQYADLTLLEPPFEIDGYHKAMVWHARCDSDPVQMWFRSVMRDVTEKEGGVGLGVKKG